MSLLEFLRLIQRNLLTLIGVPVVMACTVFLLTMGQKKEYRSSALLYTGIGSGYNIESGDSDKIDYRAVNAAYDNLIAIIKSRYTLEEVGMRLLALSISQEKPSLSLGQQAFLQLKEIFPDEKRKGIVAIDDLDQTYENIKFLYEKGHPLIVKLISDKGSFGIKTLSGIDVKRVKSSDMIELSYTSYDPGLCKETLSILVDVFGKKYKNLKKAETVDVVAYFEEELRKAKENLEAAENELTEFRVKSRVINYGEETKALAIKKQNALEESAIRQMNLKATEAALAELEQKLEDRQIILQQNIQLLEKKGELSKITTMIARLEVEKNDNQKLSSLKEQQAGLRQEVTGMVDNLVKLTTSKDGVSARQLISQWIDNLIQYNRERVNVDLFEKRLRDIDKQYDTFTPMGSNIDRLERQIGVFEREYLEVLHSLNMSKLRQQNIELTSNLEVLDPPTYPLGPEASKRFLLVLVAALFGGFSVLGFIIIGEVLNDTLKNPVIAEKKTGLKVISAFPFLGSERSNHISEKIFNQLAAQMSTRLLAKGSDLDSSKKPALNVIFSTVPNSGSKTVGKIMAQEFENLGESVLLVQPCNKNHDRTSTAKTIEYEMSKSIVNSTSIEDIAGLSIQDFDRVIFICPDLSSGLVPVKIVRDLDLAVLVERADRSWSDGKMLLIKEFSELTGIKPHLVLNGIRLHELDQLLVDVPKSRNWLTRKIRAFAKFEFGSTVPETRKH